MTQLGGVSFGVTEQKLQGLPPETAQDVRGRRRGVTASRCPPASTGRSDHSTRQDPDPKLMQLIQTEQLGL